MHTTQTTKLYITTLFAFDATYLLFTDTPIMQRICFAFCFSTNYFTSQTFCYVSIIPRCSNHHCFWLARCSKHLCYSFVCFQNSKSKEWCRAATQAHASFFSTYSTFLLNLYFPTCTFTTMTHHFFSKYFYIIH